MRYVFGVAWLGLLVWCRLGIVMVRFGYGCGMMLVWLSQGFGMVWVRFRDGCGKVLVWLRHGVGMVWNRFGMVLARFWYGVDIVVERLGVVLV
jgi:hypothetical protein